MNYIGIECPVCAEKFQNGNDVVVCPVCGTPHHRHCWQANGGCKNESRHPEGFIWQMPQNAQPEHNQVPKLDGNLKTCPRCGEKNAPYEPVCTRCGERLKANRQTVHDQIPFEPDPFGDPLYGDYTTAPNPHNFSPYQNVYAADARTVYGENAKIDGIAVTEIAEYIQKDSTKYIGKFLTMQEKKTKLSWNWSAGIFSVFWCFYRKMIACGLAILAVFFSAYLISSFVPAAIYAKYRPEVYAEYEENFEQFSKELTASVSSGEWTDSFFSTAAKILLSPIKVTSDLLLGAISLLICVFSGFFGNYFYKKKIIKDITMIRQVAADSMAYHLYLQQRGGSSVINLLLPILCYSIFSMLLSYL